MAIRFLGAVIAAILVGGMAAASRANDDGVGSTIATKLGKASGVQQGGVLHFRGLRYAKAPVGALRFKAPVASGPWEGTYDASEFPNRCVQPPGGLGTPLGGPDEDCLFLNVTTPAADDRARPVLFWIHGGGFNSGSANDYDGTVLARQGDVVVVTINYRLGLLGYADLSALGAGYSGSAANGFRDQILALEWVRDNIADFGGDPGNVTIFGESAGGHSVQSLLAAPSADGLYHKAIAHSPGTANLPAEDQTVAMAAHLGVPVDQLAASLQTKPVADIMAMQAVVSANGGRVDGVVVTRSTNEAIIERARSGVPLIAGTNLDEGTLFTMLLPQPMWAMIGSGLAMSVTSGADPAPYLDALAAAYPEDTAKENHERLWVEFFRHAAIGSTQRASAAGPGGWLYRFDLASTQAMGGQSLGATHEAEIAFTFNSFADENARSPFTLYDRNDPVVRGLAERWSATIIAFARTGNPNGAGLPEWPRYSAEDRRTLILDGNPRVEADIDAQQMQLWESVGAKL